MVLSVLADHELAERVFARIPALIDVHSNRRAYAQALSLYYAPGRQFPLAARRLRPQDDVHYTARRVSIALGHNCIDVITRHYLRQECAVNATYSLTCMRTRDGTGRWSARHANKLTLHTR